MLNLAENDLHDSLVAMAVAEMVGSWDVIPGLVASVEVLSQAWTQKDAPAALEPHLIR